MRLIAMGPDDKHVTLVPLSRRRLLSCALGVPGTALFGASGVMAAEPAVCVDPEELTPSEAGLRRSLSYTDAAPQPDRTCARCGFFSATDPSCGTCKLLNGGAVSARGHCISWSARS